MCAMLNYEIALNMLQLKEFVNESDVEWQGPRTPQKKNTKIGEAGREC